jgi:hypothetical protein
MKLTDEQKAACIEKLNSPWGSVKLRCDGHNVFLQVQRYKGLTFRVMTYVDGHFLGKWISATERFPEQKFLRPEVRPVYGKSFIRDMEKILGKRHVAKNPDYIKTVTVYMPDWASGKAAINHLCKVCESIEILQNETKETP